MNFMEYSPCPPLNVFSNNKNVGFPIDYFEIKKSENLIESIAFNSCTVFILFLISSSIKISLFTVFGTNEKIKTI